MSTLTCTVCHANFDSARITAKYCSSKCKKKASRSKNYIGQPGGVEDKVIKVDLLEGMPEGLSETDRLFYMDSLRMGPDWINFSQESWDRACYICKSKYQTRLSLLKFCQPKCQQEFLHGAA